MRLWAIKRLLLLIFFFFLAFDTALLFFLLPFTFSMSKDFWFAFLLLYFPLRRGLCILSKLSLLYSVTTLYGSEFYAC